MDYDILLKPLIGALIGYSTNYVAIKMLFRPYEEKKVFGLKVPFTPGVIPREKDRIAKSLGNAVGGSLLTEKVIRAELLNDTVKSSIKEKLLSGIFSGELTLSDILKSFFKDNTQLQKSRLKYLISKTIFEHVTSGNEYYKIEELIRSILLEKIKHETKVGEVITDPIINEMLSFVDDNSSSIVKYLKDKLEEEKTYNMLSKEVAKFTEEKLGALGAMFIDNHSITVSIINRGKEFVCDDEFTIKFRKFLKEEVKKLGENKIASLVDYYSYRDYIHKVSRQLSISIFNLIDYKIIEDVVDSFFDDIMSKRIVLEQRDKDFIEESFDDLYSSFVLNNLPVLLDTFDLSQIVERQINKFTVKETEELIFGIIDKELKAITWFGAVLGFLVGVVYIFI